MEALLLEAYMIQYRIVVKTFTELKPFLNIDEQSGFFYYRVIITLKTLFILHSIKTAIPKTWSLAWIIIGKFYVACMNPVMKLVACLCTGFILHALGLYTLQMASMGIVSMDYKSCEFLLDIYVLLCSLYYVVQAYRGEIKKLSLVLSMGLSIAPYINDEIPLPFGICTYCIIIVFYTTTIFLLLPNRPEHRDRIMFFCMGMYLLILYKMGYRYDKSQSSASQTGNSSDVCMILQNNFKAEQCGLIEALENQDESDCAKSLNMSDWADYDTRKPLDITMKSLRKKTVFKNTADVKQKRAVGEYKLDPQETGASVNIKSDGRIYIQKEIIYDETPANEELVEKEDRKDREPKVTEKNENHILIFGTEERNDIVKKDYTELRQEPFIQVFIQINEDQKKDVKRLSGNIKQTVTTEDTSSNEELKKPEQHVVKESSVEDISNIKKRLGNVKTPKGGRLSTGTKQEDIVCKISENTSVNFEDSINYSSFISKQERGRKENETELEAIDVYDVVRTEPEEVFDVNKSEVILTNATANDYPMEADDTGVTKPPLKGTENTKPTTLLAGELEMEPKTFKINKGPVIEASESENFLSEALVDNPIDADDSGARVLELTKDSDRGTSNLEPSTAKHPGANKREPSKAANNESIQTQEIKVRKPEGDENEIFEPNNKGKAIHVRKAEMILSTEPFADHPNEADEGVKTQACKHEVRVSQEPETGDTEASEFQATISNKINAVESQASKVGNYGGNEPTAAQANKTRANETVEAGSTDSVEVDAELKTIHARKADTSKASAPGPSEFEPTKSIDSSATELQAIKTNKASATVLERNESSDTEGIEPQASETDESGGTEAWETDTTKADKAKPAKISYLGASGLENIKDSGLGATQHEPTKTGKVQKKETKVYAAHKGKDIDAIKIKVLTADHSSETEKCDTVASQARNVGETEATETPATKTNGANAIEPEECETGDNGKSELQAVRANAAKANETREVGTTGTGEVEATDPKQSRAREKEPSKARELGPIKLHPTEANDSRKTDSLATKAVEAQEAQDTEADASEAGTTEVGEAEANEPKATQFREAEPAKSSNPSGTELQDTNSKEAGATEPQESEDGSNGATKLHASQADEGEASEVESAKGSDPRASEIEPTQTSEAEEKETEIHEAHKSKAINVSEAEAILPKALPDEHQSKAGQSEAAASQATNTGDNGATQLQATKPNEAKTIEFHTSVAGSSGETKNKVAQTNEARTTETGETGTIDAYEVEATDPKTTQSREGESAKVSDPGPIKIQSTEANVPRTSEPFATKHIEANTQAEASEAGTTEIDEAETTERKATQSQGSEPAKSNDPGFNKLQTADSNDSGETGPQGIEIGDVGTTEIQAARVEAGEADEIEADWAEPVKGSDPDASELESTKDNGPETSESQFIQTGEAKKTETGVYESHQGESVDVSESNAIFKASEAITAGATESQALDACENGASQAGETTATESKAIENSEGGATGLEMFVPREWETINTTEFEAVSLSPEAGELEATKFETKTFKNNSKSVKELFHSLVSVNDELVKRKDWEAEI